MSGRIAEKTLAERVYQRIRADILAARLLPGRRMKLAMLCADYGVSLSVVREAMTRLAAEKLIRVQPQHGFTVPSLSEAELRDMTAVRSAIETMALRRSIERGDVAWEARIVAAHHTLANTPVHVADGSRRVSDAYTAAHANFHATLVDACNSPCLLDIRASLFDATALYRLLSVPLNPDLRNKTGEHKAIMDAALARDIESAAALLAAHIDHTLQIILTSGILGREEDEGTALVSGSFAIANG